MERMYAELKELLELLKQMNAKEIHVMLAAARKIKPRAKEE